MALIVVLVNKSDLAEVSNYDYEVMVGDGSPTRSKTIAKGRVDGHVRSEGWQVLVKKLLDKETI